MPNVSVAEIRARLDSMLARWRELDAESQRNGRMIKRHNSWRMDYLDYPYLVGAPDERLASRFHDVFINQAELSPSGKIGQAPITGDDSYMAKFTHMLEEYGARRGDHPPKDVVQAAREPLLRYFANGGPIALKIFNGYVAPNIPILVKYGSREYLEPMLKDGNLRICPASYYNHPSHIASVMDNETSRTFYIPTFQKRLAGIQHIDFEGKRIDFGDDDISLPVVVPDYFLFSLCNHIYYRMPTDFNSDAVLIIHDPIIFCQRVISAFLASWPDWEPMHGEVTYYDPYRDYTRIKVPEMSKHFGYAYQREYRIAFRATTHTKVALHPEILSIGSMTDYAELLLA